MLLKRSALERQVALACRTGHYFLRGRDGRQLGGQYRNFTFSERGTKDCVHFCSYIDLLLKSQRCTMHVSRLRSLSLEIFKTLHNLNPSFMKDIFQIRTSNYSSRNPNNLIHYRPNQVTFGTNSLKSLGPRIWNCLPEELKSVNSLNIFKSLITQWNGPTCNCNACRFIVNIV